MMKINKQSISRVLVMLIVFILWLTVSPITAFFWSLFLIWAVFKLDSRIIGIGALTLLVMIPIVLSTDLYEYLAEQLAVYVFFLLCITVALQMIELRREDSVPKVEQIQLPKNTNIGQKINKFEIKQLEPSRNINVTQVINAPRARQLKLVIDKIAQPEASKPLVSQPKLVVETKIINKIDKPENKKFESITTTKAERKISRFEDITLPDYSK